MSTRCNIIIKDGYSNDRVILYHHHDGYPEGVGVQLRKVLNDWQDWQVKQHGMRFLPNNLIKNECGLNDKEYEITPCLHGDIEYCYVINCKARTLRCYRIPWDEETHAGFYIHFDKVFRRRNLVDIPKWEKGQPTMYENPLHEN